MGKALLKFRIRRAVAGLEVNNFCLLRKETCLEPGNPASQGSKIPHLAG